MLKENLKKSGLLRGMIARVSQPLIAAAVAASLGAAITGSEAHAKITLDRIGSYETGIFDQSAAEIAAFDPVNDRVFVTNSDSDAVDVLDVSDPASPTRIGSFDFSALAATGINSVAVKNGIVAVALAADAAADAGIVAFYDASVADPSAAAPLATTPAGYLPDMLTFSADGTQVYVANEGEASDTLDGSGIPIANPEGSVSIITVSGNASSFSVDSNVTVDLSVFNAGGSLALGATMEEITAPVAGTDAPKVRIHPNADSVAADLEPEYIAVSPDGTTLYVAAQENNALIVVDVASGEATGILPLGMKDHSYLFNALDADKNDEEANIVPQPFFGIYMPDAIAAYEANGETYIVTANEGDGRDPDDFGEFADGALGDEMDVQDLDLDDEIFPNEATILDGSGLGDLGTFVFGNDLDADGEAEQIVIPGARSFSIFDSSGKLVFDSGADFERITAAFLPDNFNASNDDNSIDDRSDNKGPEPEAVAIGEIDGHTYAFIGLERVSGIMIYDVTNPYSPVFVDYVTERDFSLAPESQSDVGPEGLVFVPAADSPNGENLLILSSEVSGTTSVFQIVNKATTKLQILHASDLEGGVDALDNAPNFAAIVEALEIDALGKAIPSVLLSAGDNYIPGPFFSASGDRSMRDIFQSAYQDFFMEPGLTNIREATGRVDISLMNVMGFDASAMGNHEFDAGTSAIEDIIMTDIRGTTLGDVRWLGAQFPYLSANLDFSNDGLGDVYTSDILANTAFQSMPGDLEAAGNAPKIAPATVINIGGEYVGVVGATTQLIQQISSPGDVLETTGGSNDMAALAVVLQPVVDSLATMTNKIILVSHLQQIALEEELATLLSGVDVIIAGGSDTLLANDDDVLRSGDTADRAYPVETTDKDGAPVAIVSTDGEYSYVGRLVLEFNSDGEIITDSLSDTINGPYATTSDMVETLWGDADLAFSKGSKGGRAQFLIEEGVFPVITAKDGNILGLTSVFIEGRRSKVRTEETTLGNLTADANLVVAQAHDSTVRVSLKNGGGIRAAIGDVVGNNGLLLPPQANALSGKTAGEISQLDIENALRFNNGLTLLTVTAEELVLLLEHGVARSGEGATPGQFPQVGGLAFSFDPEGTPVEFDDEANVVTAGTRVKNVVLLDSAGNPDVQILKDGELVVAADYAIRMVTLNFLWGIFSDSDFIGGDGYPFPAFSEDVVQLGDVLAEAGDSTFADPGSEQDALAEYLLANYASTPYDIVEGGPANDFRIKQTSASGSDDLVIIELSRETVSVSGLAESVVIGVQAIDSFNWRSVSNDSWLSIASGRAGSGNGFVIINVARNTGEARSGTVTIGGQTVTIEQAAATVAVDDSLRQRLPDDSVENTDGSIQSEWFGRFFTIGNEGFAQHDTWGDILLAQIVPGQGAWFYDFAQGGWNFGSETTPPWTYSASRDAWVYPVVLDDGTTVVFNTQTQEWELL